MKNIVFSVCGYGLIFIMGLVLRKVFLLNLDFDNLGYEGLFTNIFTVLMMADLGAGSLVIYRLYGALAGKNDQEVARLVAMYRWLLMGFSGVVLGIGLLLMPLLPMVIGGEVADWGYVRLIYILQLLGQAATLPLGYGSVLLDADQKNFETMRIWTIMRIATQVLKALAILLFQSYVVYLLLAIVCNLTTGLITTLRAKRLNPGALKGKCTLADFKKDGGFLEELKGVGVSRLLSAVYYATDSVLISAILGVSSVAMYGNYTMISNNINAMFDGLIRPLTGSIGNYVNTETNADRFHLFETVDLFCFMCASFAMTSYGVLLQPAIELFFGSQYLLPMPFVLLFSASHYLFIKCMGLNAFRNTFGKYREEWFWLGLSAVSNVVISVLCCRAFGIVGIVAGTVASLVFMWMGKSVLSFRYCFECKCGGYMFKQGLRFLLAWAELALTMYITQGLPVTIGGVALRALACVVAPNAINLLLSWHTPAFARMRSYGEKVKDIIKNRGKEPEDV